MTFVPLKGRDRVVLNRQMARRRFDPSAALAVACRCGHGMPQVILCRPLKGGLPFPTTLWLTCPWLVKTLGRMESHGGVTALEEDLAKKPHHWRRYQRAYARLRLSLLAPAQRAFLARYQPQLWRSLAQGGVGGIRSAEPTAKCLHLQVGALLGMGWHPAGRWLRDRLGPLTCPCPADWPCGQIKTCATSQNSVE